MFGYTDIAIGHFPATEDEPVEQAGSVIRA